MAGANEYRDERTGARIVDLTPDAEAAQVIYQTHAMWLPDMSRLVCYAQGASGLVPQVRRMDTGEMRPLIDESAGAAVLDAGRGIFYYVSGRDIMEVEVEHAFSASGGPRKVAALPESALDISGGLSIEEKGDRLYAGVTLEKDARWSILALDIASGQWSPVTEVDFRVGHVQANPAKPGRIMFCHETGGDAPQRTWAVDLGDAAPRPFYKETYDEWVTHETWWGKNRAAFTIWPYDDEHKRLSHGVASFDADTGAFKVHAKFPAWHTHGSPDGKWLVADDFDRNLWLIDATTDERRLLTQGHLGEGFKTHPHPSFTPDGRYVIFNSSRTGKEHICLVESPKWDSLPLP